MKRKYENRLRKSLIVFLSFLISMGSFIGLFAINTIQSSAYEVTGTGQLKLRSGVCYNGKNAADPFIYTTERMGINSSTWLPTYNRGNDGAGGNIGGSTEILMKRINTGSAWSSVPLYRVSRSGGYSDNLPYVTGDATDIVGFAQIQTAINNLSGINRNVSVNEAEMIRKVLINGFKAGSEITGSGNNYSWDDNLRYAATQILIWEIQEGKRWSFGTADGNYRQEADTVGSNPWYWKQWWDNVVMPAAYPGATNWYYKILDMCQATSESMNVTADNSGSSATASTRKSSAGTLNAQYYDGNYELSFHLSNSNLWGNNYGQFNASSVTWEPDEGSRNASLSWSGSTGYLTSSSDNPDEPISGYLKFTQKASSGDFNDIGYMSGSTSNSWRGFMFGGNSEATKLYIRVGSTGGPTPMTVKFVNESGSAVNVDWNFKVNDTNITEFTENSSGKTFVPQYYLDHHAQANYKINIASVPQQYQLPAELATVFYYTSETGVLKHGTGSSSTGWGSWDYGACQASFSGNTITITLKNKDPGPVTVKFVDGNTGELLKANFDWYQSNIVFEFQQSFSGSNRYTWTPTKKTNQRIKITEVPEGYSLPENFSFNFSYVYGFPLLLETYSFVSLEDDTFTVKLYKTEEAEAVTIEFRDKTTGVLLDNNAVYWSCTKPDGQKLVLLSSDTQYTTQLPTDGNYKINISDRINSGASIPDVSFTYNSQSSGSNKVWPAADNANSNVKISGRTVTIYLLVADTAKRGAVSIRFLDGNTGAPVYPTWTLRMVSDSITTVYQSTSSWMETFVPAYPAYTGNQITFMFQMEGAPEGYILPDKPAFIFYYSNEDYKISPNPNFANDYVNYDTERNLITVKLFPSPVEPDKPETDIDISFLTPNSDYHFGEEVISSYYLKNKNDRAYSPATTELKARLTLEKIENGTVTAAANTEITNIVCPGNATQLIYFKWSVPELLSTGNESWQLHTYVYDSAGNQTAESVDEVTVSAKAQTDTPPNKFDLNGGKSFLPISPLAKNQDYYNSSSWQEYVWENGGFVVKTYSAKLWNDEITVYPDETNPSATLQNGKDITSRSGYGMKLRLKARIDQYDGAIEFTNADQVTAVQYATAYYPEQSYSTENDKYSTLELTSSGFVFPVYANSTYEPGEKGDGRKHFIPMWYPDGQYTVQCQTSGCWTPAGMIDYTDEANPVIIKGSLYDDWYSSGGGK